MGSFAYSCPKVGSQIESISWMTAGGFQTAMSAFVGQNYGAKNGIGLSRAILLE